MVLSFINDLGGLNLSISGMAHFGLHAQPAPEVSGTSALSKPGGREEVKTLRYHGVVHRVYIYTYIHTWDNEIFWDIIMVCIYKICIAKNLYYLV